MLRASVLAIGRAAPARAGAWIARLTALDSWPVAALALLALLSGYRAQLVDRTYGTYTGCHGCLNASVVACDSSLLVAFAAAVALVRCGVPRAIRWLVAAACVAGVLFFAADIVVFRLLSQRLLLVDLLHFGGDGARLVSVVAPWAVQGHGALALAVMGATVVAAWQSLAAPPAGARRGMWILVASAMLALASAVPRSEYIHQLVYFNVWQVNAQVDPARPYSAEFRRHNAKAPPPLLDCEQGLTQRPSIVLVVVESLSAYHSRLFSGLRDDTPLMDELARQGSYMKSFHANGYSTEGGLISLLTGYVPIPTAGRFGSVMAFTQTRDDFHRWLHSLGYDTAFFTTGDLDFGKRRAWLQRLGIGHAEGADHPFYRGMPRAAFGAAQDAALVDRFLGWYDHERKHGPFMATLLTVGTHPPFVIPGEGAVGEDAVVREADRQVARLVQGLRERRFLENGVLIVVGDHRAMTPISRAERERLGPAAEVRVVAFAMGKTGVAPGPLEGNFQQIDLIPSLRYLIAQRACRDEWQGRFLGPRPDPADELIHADPLQRNELTVIEGPREYRIQLDGDDTRFVDEAPPAVRAETLLRRVNAERIGRMGELTPRR